MPIYEYRCEHCGHELEALQKVSDAPLTECPACHAHGLKKLISAAAFRLKGSGWYETDFKNSNKKNLHGDGGSKDGGDASSKKADSADATSAKKDKPAGGAKTDGASKGASKGSDAAA